MAPHSLEPMLWAHTETQAEEGNDAVSQGLKNTSESSKDSHLSTSYSSNVKLPDNFSHVPEATCLAVRGFLS